MPDKNFTIIFYYKYTIGKETFWTPGVRVNVPAESMEEAKQKATKFAISKIEVVFDDKSREAIEKEFTRVQKIMNKISSLMDDIFSTKKT